ncbi:MAG TPA: hypothetical protein VHL54_04165, partial [Actinomycetota bacterium]|nr:hypothetical protein [Actinomycetota bacterium]
ACVLTPLPARAGGGGHCPEPMPVVEPGRVLVLDSCFAPLHQEISTGQTVTWDASQAGLHTVTFQNLNSGDVVGTFVARFDQPGTYPFACAYHPGMIGSITVVGAEAGEVPILALTEMREMRGQIFTPTEEFPDPPVVQAAGESLPEVGKAGLSFTLSDWPVIAVGVALVVLVAAAASTIGVRVARR